jgi:hypothetical protein
MSGKYKTREEKLRNKISEELSHQKPSIDYIIQFVNEFEEDNLKTIAKLNRVKKLDDNKIKGALKQTINAHGPITFDYIGSATKRINGALLTDEDVSSISRIAHDSLPYYRQNQKTSS